MNTLVPLLIATTIIGVISGFAIWLVGKLRLGLEVDGFGRAFLAGILIAFLAGVITLFPGIAGFIDSGGLIGGIVHLIISAIVLMISARLLPGFKVAGFGGVL